ncbi:MAG: hypothetical protein HC929_10360 [Leptolyngbyaceae cyanobacterium SM2_5_2]|nr:hypothetical protein [Leptolyngbyaceae cyanobacterium SM2_5_2]
MLPDESSALPDIQQEIRLSRSFSLADLIGQEGGSMMKGESPVPKLVQAKGEALQTLKATLTDRHGALQSVLQRWMEADETRLSRHMETPTDALKDLLESILASPETLYELVRQADVTWGHLYDERPHFQQPGQTPHPDDEYTHESVRLALMDCLQRLNAPPTTETVEPDE